MHNEEMIKTDFQLLNNPTQKPEAEESTDSINPPEIFFTKAPLPPETLGEKMAISSCPVVFLKKNYELKT